MQKPSDELAAMIERLRRSGLTQAAIAREANVSRVSIWRIATDQAKQPSHQTYAKLDALCRRHCPEIR